MKREQAEAITLAELEIGKEHHDIVRALRSRMGLETAAEVSSLVPAAIHGFDMEQRRCVVALQRTLPALVTRRQAVRSRLVGPVCVVNELAVPAPLQKVLGKLRKELGANDLLVVDQILELDVDSFAKRPGIGPKYQEAFATLRAMLRTQSPEAASGSARADSICVPLAAPDISVEEVCTLLLADLRKYVASLDDRSRAILKGRLGLGIPQQTLDELGRPYELTRERVRQLEVDLKQPLRRGRLPPPVLWSVVRRIVDADEDLAIHLRSVASEFDTQERFIEYLELVCDVEPKTLTAAQCLDGHVRATALDDFFARNRSPVPLRECEAELMSELGLTLPQASRYLERLALAGRVRLTPDGVSPRGIRKEAAIAHVLLDHPAGLPWKNIARIVNERGYSELPEDRLDGTYTDSDLIYLCERGTYRHTAFFPVPLSHRQRVLATVRAHLDATTASTNMRNLVLETRDKLQLDYFDLRYLIATFGEAHGLYFDGASARDTVKLDAAAPAVPLRGSILRAFDNAAEPLTAQEVADALKIRTAQFAQQHIEALRQEGKVMRVGRRLFTTVRKATKGVDVALIEAIITSTLTAAPGPVEEDVFREAINSVLHLSHSRFFYGDLARNLARRSSWHVQRTLFAVSPIEVESLTDVFDRSFVATDTDEEILERVAGRVWMSARTRKMVADWVRLRRRQSSPSIVAQFAEDS